MLSSCILAEDEEFGQRGAGALTPLAPAAPHGAGDAATSCARGFEEGRGWSKEIDTVFQPR